MTNLIWIAIVLVTSYFSYRKGWDRGCDFTLEYFNKHPIPKEWLEKK